MKKFESDLETIGREMLSKLEAENSNALVIIGRSYSCFDSNLNLNIPEKLSQYGIPILPMDALPLEDIPVDKRFPTLYWKQGRRMIQAASLVAKHPLLNAVFLTNHAKA